MNKTIEIRAQLTDEQADEFRSREGDTLQIVVIERDADTGKTLIRLRSNDGLMLPMRPSVPYEN